MCRSILGLRRGLWPIRYMGSNLCGEVGPVDMGLGSINGEGACIYRKWGPLNEVKTAVDHPFMASSDKER